MNNDILNVKANSNDRPEEIVQISVEPYIFIVLLLILICILDLINVNVFEFVFGMTKQLDNAFRNLAGFVSSLGSNLHFDRIIEQMSQIF